MTTVRLDPPVVVDDREYRFADVWLHTFTTEPRIERAHYGFQLKVGGWSAVTRSVRGSEIPQEVQLAAWYAFHQAGVQAVEKHQREVNIAMAKIAELEAAQVTA